jgi:hypothetical protein
MTDIDPQAEIELHPANEYLTVRVPLAGAVTGDWLRCHQQLALATKVPAQAQAQDERAWIVVTVPAASDQGEVAATMDAARALIAEADAAARPPGRLLVDLVQGGPETSSATDLLKTGFLVWLYTIIAFSFIYWTLDGGGAELRFLDPPQFPDLAFPAQLNPGVARPGWRPEFFDYLYLGFTNATAFSQ